MRLDWPWLSVMWVSPVSVSALSQAHLWLVRLNISSTQSYEWLWSFHLGICDKVNISHIEGQIFLHFVLCQDISSKIHNIYHFLARPGTLNCWVQRSFCICGSIREKFSHLLAGMTRPLLCVRVLNDDSSASRNRCHPIPMDPGAHLLHRLWASTGTRAATYTH